SNQRFSFHYYGTASFLVKPGTADELLEKFLNGRSKLMFGSWFDHVNGWLDAKYQDNIFYIAYEEMIQVRSVSRIAEFLGKSLSPEVIDKIANLLTTLCLSGIAGDWKNLFTEALTERFDAIYQEQMKGVKFKFAWN
uniref:Sulfotransferase n=1 Tax=Electrophorus electricus TaxID=8005 RepID=A0A4W4ETR5_ELEEL